MVKDKAQEILDGVISVDEHIKQLRIINNKDIYLSILTYINSILKP